MVQRVTIPLSWANNIPGVSGIEDVEFRVPELEDIDDIIADAIPVPDLLREFFEELEQQSDPGEPLPVTLAQVIAAEVGEFIVGEQIAEELDLEKLASAIANQISVDVPSEIDVGIQGSLFSVDEDVVRFAQNLIGRLQEEGVLPLVDIPEFPDPLTDPESDFGRFVNDPAGFLTDVLSGDVEGFDGIQVPDLPDVQEAAERALREVEPTIDGAGLFSEPVRFFVKAIERFLEDAVTADTQQRVSNLAEDFR